MKRMAGGGTRGSTATLTPVAAALCVCAFVVLTPSNHVDGFRLMTMTTTPGVSTRRAFLPAALLAPTATAAMATPPAANAAVIAVARCDSGVGDGCEANAKESEVIRNLLQSSKQNRKKYERENLERYNLNNYKDYFAAGTVPRTLVQHPVTRKYDAVPDDELRVLVREGKVIPGQSGSPIDNYASRADYTFTEIESQRRGGGMGKAAAAVPEPGAEVPSGVPASQ